MFLGFPLGTHRICSRIHRLSSSDLQLRNDPGEVLSRIVMPRNPLALSLKQPWATLLAHGIKTIEIRRWSTKCRGKILIHAARIPDPRPEGWALVPKEWLTQAELVGGIIGIGELTECVVYRTPETFAADREKHLNDPAWFQDPAMFGFVFTNLKALPFRRYPGWMRFFEVAPETAEPKVPKSARIQKIHGWWD